MIRPIQIGRNNPSFCVKQGKVRFNRLIQAKLIQQCISFCKAAAIRQRPAHRRSIRQGFNAAAVSVVLLAEKVRRVLIGGFICSDDKQLKGQLHKQKEKQENEKNSSSEVKVKRQNNHSRKLSFKERKELERLEEEISVLENEKKEIIESLSNGLASVEKITEMSKRLPLCEKELDEKSNRWLELSEIEG